MKEPVNRVNIFTCIELFSSLFPAAIARQEEQISSASYPMPSESLREAPARLSICSTGQGAPRSKHC
jgi:hypothetical protein